MTKDVSKFDYLRHRPFLVLDVTSHPAANVHTERKGWTKNNQNVDLKEHPMILDRISTKVIQQATVIIDIINETVIKNRFRLQQETATPEAFDEQMRKHLMQKYASLIDQARNAWMPRVSA